MFALVQKSTTTVPLLFLMVLTSDHITGAIGLSPTVKIGKNGAAGTAPSGAVSEIDATNLPGWYQVAGNATDTNTYGPIALHATAATADPSDCVPAMVVGFDPSVANLAANVIQINSQTASASGTVTFPNATLASTTNITAGTITTATNLTNAPTAGDFTATMKASLITAASASSPTLDWSKVTNQSSVVILSNTLISEVVNVNNILAGGITTATFAAGVLPANFDLLAIDGSGDVTYNNAAPPSVAAITTAVLTTAMTESYAALHASPSLAQGFFEIRGILAEGSVAEAVMTINGIDGVTAKETFALNSATAPTSINRAS